MLTKKQQTVRLRVFAIVSVLVLAIAGLATLLRGTFTYRNYWGGIVFVPLVLAVLPLLLAAGFKITRSSDSAGDPRNSYKRRHKEEEVRNTRFPIDDFDEPWNG